MNRQEKCSKLFEELLDGIDAGILFSTFVCNMYLGLYLAPKYTNRITFILKPHPNLGVRAVETKIFEDFNAYEAYLDEWNALPNARVVQEKDTLAEVRKEIFEEELNYYKENHCLASEYIYADISALLNKQ